MINWIFFIVGCLLTLGGLIKEFLPERYKGYHKTISRLIAIGGVIILFSNIPNNEDNNNFTPDEYADAVVLKFKDINLLDELSDNDRFQLIELANKIDLIAINSFDSGTACIAREEFSKANIHYTHSINLLLSNKTIDSSKLGKVFFLNGVALYYLGKLEESVGNLYRTIKLRRNLANSFFNLSMVKLIKQNYFESLILLDSANHYNYKKTEIYNYKSYIYFQINNDSSLYYCDQTLSLDQGNYQAWNLKGLFYAKLSKSKEAIECFKKSLKYNPTFHLALNNIGVAYCELLRKPDTALIFFDSALVYKQDYSNAYFHKGVAYMDLDSLYQSKLSFFKAIKYYKFTDLDFDISFAWNNLGNVEQIIGNCDTALFYFEQSIKYDSLHYGAYYNKGKMLVNLGRIDEGIQYFKKSHQINPHQRVNVIGLINEIKRVASGESNTFQFGQIKCLEN